MLLGSVSDLAIFKFFLQEVPPFGVTLKLSLQADLMLY